jgi:hypothetical protein
MKRISSIGFAAVLVVALAIPAAPAVARGGHHHAKKRGHKARHHVVLRKKHRSLRISDAGDPRVADRIGQIVTFDTTTHLLTIKLDGGKTIEGTVTDDTRIKCVGAPTPAPTAAPTRARSAHNDDGEWGDRGDRSDDFDDDEGDDRSGSYPGSGDYPGDRGRHRGHCDHGDDTRCTIADLVPEAVVRGAELTLTKDGLVFEKIKLAK